MSVVAAGMAPCWRCAGTGLVERDGDGGPGDGMEPCHVCGGDGAVDRRDAGEAFELGRADHIRDHRD